MIRGFVNKKRELKNKYNKIYDALVELCNADNQMRSAFVNEHIKTNCCCEWRFCGKLGFGGKYLSRLNKVTCYKEDENEDRLNLIKIVNSKLSLM